MSKDVCESEKRSLIRKSQSASSRWRHGSQMLMVRLQLLWITGSTILQVRPRDEMMA